MRPHLCGGAEGKGRVVMKKEQELRDILHGQE